MTIDLISSTTFFLAALSFLLGIRAWKREFQGKRRIELAESVLALFYETKDAIRHIRYPIAKDGEGSTRKPAEDESIQDKIFRDQGYIQQERLETYRALFANLRSKRYRFKAVFGVDMGEHFTEINSIIEEIFDAAKQLHYDAKCREKYCEMDEDERRTLMDDYTRLDKIVMYDGENDEISKRVQKAVMGIEAVLSQANKKW